MSEDGGTESFQVTSTVRAAKREGAGIWTTCEADKEVARPTFVATFDDVDFKPAPAKDFGDAPTVVRSCADFTAYEDALAIFERGTPDVRRTQTVPHTDSTARAAVSSRCPAGCPACTFTCTHSTCCTVACMCKCKCVSVCTCTCAWIHARHVVTYTEGGA